MPRPEDFGFTDEKLLSHPTVYAPDLFRGKKVLVSGAGSRRRRRCAGGWERS